MSDVERLSPDGSLAATKALNWLLVILLVLMATYMVLTQARTGKPVTARGNLSDEEKTTIEIFRRASPSVVNITSIAVRKNLLTADVTTAPKGTGSGVVWDEAGYIVTNLHVLAGTNAAKVTLADNSEWDARLAGLAPHQDLAVLKIDAPRRQLHPIAIGTSADLQVGQTVFAIGNPFGLDQTLTTGIISQVGRELVSDTGHPIQGVIQTNASINPGNSGGPLLDSAGLMIGINSAIYSSSGVNVGIGFAVPVDTVRKVVEQLIRDGKVEQIDIGADFWPDWFTAQQGLRGRLVVRNVYEGSPAAEAGLVSSREDPEGRKIILGDMIVAINKQPVRSSIDYYRAIENMKAGNTVTVTVQRGNATQDIPVTLRALE